MADKRISQLVDRGTIANNDVVPIVVSGAVTTNKATISSIQTFMQGNLDFGVTSVGITLGSSGTDVSVSGSPITTSGNITINIPTASATNRGLLSSADWTTFNAKQPAGNYVTTDTVQNITAGKTFITNGNSDSVGILHTSGNGRGLIISKSGGNEALRVEKISGSGNAVTITGGLLSAEAATFTGNILSNEFLYVREQNASTLLANYTQIYTNSTFFGFTNGAGTGSAVFTYNGARNYTLPNASGTLALTSDIPSLAGYVTLGTAQTITAQKTFTTSGGSDTLIVDHTSGSGIALDISKAGNGEGLRVTKTSGSGNAMSVSGGNSNFAGGITTTSAVLTSVLQGVNANFTSLIETSADIRVGTTASIKHNSTGYTLSGFNNIQGNINSFVVTNESKNLRLNFPSVGGLTHTLPDTSGTLALTTDLGAYLPLTGGTLTGALNGTSASFGGLLTINVPTDDTTVGIFHAGGGTPNRGLKISTFVSTNNNAGVRLDAQTLVGGARLSLATAGVDRLSIDSTGAATFSSSVTAKQLNIEDDGSVISNVVAAFGNSAISRWDIRNAGSPTSRRILSGYIASSETIRFDPLSNCYFNTGGNVGIGTPSPAFKTDISYADNEYKPGLRVKNTTNASQAQSRIDIENSAGTILSLMSQSPSVNNGEAFVTTSNTTPLVFGVNYLGRMSINSDGYLRMAAGTGGIQFNGDTAAANALDDYEEGTWTMGISFGGSSTGVTYGTNTGTYTKIGRQVTVNGYIELTNKGSSTGSAQITGLPFLIPNLVQNYAAATLFPINISFANQFLGIGAVNTTIINMEEITEAGAVSTITNSEFANNSGVVLSFTYFV